MYPHHNLVFECWVTDMIRYPLDGLVGTLLNSFTQTNCKQEVTAITAALVNSGSNISSACLGHFEMVCYDRLCSRPILHTAQYFTSSIFTEAIPECEIAITMLAINI